MRAPRVFAAIGAIALVAVLMVAAGSGGVRLAERWPSVPFGDTAFDAGVAPTPEPAPLAPEGEAAEQEPSLLGDIIGFVLLAAIVVWFSSFLRRIARRLFGSDRAEPVDEIEFEPDRLDERVVPALADDAARHRAALATGEPRNAIVRCWLALEASIAAAGVERRPSDTPSDLVVRTLHETGLDSVALGRLAELYREARFSEHPIGEANRAAALAALDSIHVALGGHSNGRVEAP